MRNKLRVGIFVVAVLFAACQPSTPSGEFRVDYTKFELENGLDVVFHIDRSDPVVAVALTAHVGSAREKVGRTGFAHLFEHLLFLESENLGKGGLDKLSARVGGSGANGSTNRDRTNYFQTVPNDALEKMLWAEADKLGWFINTVTEPVLAKEKQVVKNEKRQSYDNRPYGHTDYIIDKHLYPEDHPYNWQVIGSLEDVQNTTVDDVKEFFRRWYVPNNVTLVVAGDFDVEQAKGWVYKYFSEIPTGQPVEPLPKRPGVVKETKKLFHEDNFARLPELTLAWPTVEQYHPDAYPLAVLAQYLSEGKQAPLYQVLVEEKKLTDNVRMRNGPSELAGQMELAVRAYDGKDLDQVWEGIQQGLERFEAEGISEQDLARIKAGQETRFYNGLASVLGKGFQLAQYNIFAGDPGFIEKDIQYTLAVTPSDVQRVYRKYVKDQPFIATSFVPKGQIELALAGATQAEVVEEPIIQGAEETFDASLVAEYERTPSTFDRTVEPPYGNSPEVKVPDIWEDELPNGLKVYGIENSEVPLIRFEVVIDGGQLLDQLELVGVANLTAQMLMKGTRSKTAVELEGAIDQLGASINVFASERDIRLSVNTLSRHYAETLSLFEEILFQPRWDTTEFELLKQSTISRIQQQSASPNAIASFAFQSIIYGEDHILSQNILGTEKSVSHISLEDVQDYYDLYFSPSVARMHVVGDIDQAEVMNSLQYMADNWGSKEVIIPTYEVPSQPDHAQVYFFDIPGAKQSVLQIGTPALSYSDPDFYPATVMNYRLGGGGFASELTQQLREGKGYTYGVRSGFQGFKSSGYFAIRSGVRSNVTLEATSLIRDILIDYPAQFDEQDLATTKSFLIKSNARAFETSFAKLSVLRNISTYELPYDYVNQREAIVREMTVNEVKKLARQYTQPDQMFWIVVGDAATQMDRLSLLGYGNPILLNERIDL